MADYSKYSIPSPDSYHSVFADCNACLDSIITDEEFTVKELLEAIEEHDKVCIPKPWNYYRGYLIDDHESWHGPEFVTDVRKAELLEQPRGNGFLIKFEPRIY